MRHGTFFALAVVVGALGVQSAPVAAQGRMSTEVPAEFPPASYSGRQYVDSRGCVYVRAGIDGAVDWVPRVTRARSHLCGAQPTFAQGAPAQTARRAAETAPDVVQITLDEPASAPVEAAPAPERRVVTTRAPGPRVAAPQRVVAAPRPQSVTAPPAPQPAPRLTLQQAARAACDQSASARTQYTYEGRRYTARCASEAPAPQVAAAPAPAPVAIAAPQARRTAQEVSHVTIVRRGEAPGPGKNVYRLPGASMQTAQASQASRLPGSTRIVPRHVYESRDDQVVVTPRDYRPAFDDDRLNRKRANQSIDGYMATQLVWTNTVPRRLIDRSSGRDVTARYPKLVYPYTDMGTQNAAMSTQGQVRAVATQPRTATSAVSAPRQPAQASGGRFVQVGTFGVPANAERTARRLQAMGLPVRFSAYSRGGQNLRVVMAGPFSSQSALNSALSSARRAGFGDAFVR